MHHPISFGYSALVLANPWLVKIAAVLHHAHVTSIQEEEERTRRSLSIAANEKQSAKQNLQEQLKFFISLVADFEKQLSLIADDESKLRDQLDRISTELSILTKAQRRQSLAASDAQLLLDQRSCLEEQTQATWASLEALISKRNAAIRAREIYESIVERVRQSLVGQSIQDLDAGGDLTYKIGLPPIDDDSAQSETVAQALDSCSTHLMNLASSRFREHRYQFRLVLLASLRDRIQLSPQRHHELDSFFQSHRSASERLTSADTDEDLAKWSVCWTNLMHHCDRFGDDATMTKLQQALLVMSADSSNRYLVRSNSTQKKISSSLLTFSLCLSLDLTHHATDDRSSAPIEER